MFVRTKHAMWKSNLCINGHLYVSAMAERKSPTYHGFDSTDVYELVLVLYCWEGNGKLLNIYCILYQRHPSKLAVTEVSFRTCNIVYMYICYDRIVVSDLSCQHTSLGSIPSRSCIFMIGSEYFILVQSFKMSAQ